MNNLSEIINSEPDSRNAAADLLKGLAVLFMIQVHITELLATESIYRSIAGKISLFLGGPPAAPVFMAVMGYFIAKSKKDIQSGLLRGLTLFAGGIVLNVLLNATLIFKFFLGTAEVNPLQYIFAVDILPLAGLSIIVISALKFFFRDKVYLYGVFTVLIIAVNQFIPQGYSPENSSLRYISAYIFSSEHWSYFPLLPWLVYPLIGFIFALSEKKLTLKANQNYMIEGIFILFFILTINTVFDTVTSLPDYYHHSIELIIWNILFLAGYAAAAGVIEKAAGVWFVMKWIKWIGKNVTAAYVIQWIILGNAGSLFYKSLDGLWFFVWFAGVLVFVTAGIWFWGEYKNKIIIGD